ncbi:MAG: DUF1707 SHOCT-like domain-containing protein [Acidimicrobiales bacterium]
MRVSDTERQRAIDELGRHLAAGRLDADEYTARVTAAALAVDLGDLDRVFGDLPMLRIADPGARRGAAPAVRPGARPRWRARLIVFATVVVLAAGIVLAVVAQWLALGALLGAWMIGAVQGRLFSTRR